MAKLLTGYLHNQINKISVKIQLTKHKSKPTTLYKMYNVLVVIENLNVHRQKSLTDLDQKIFSLITNARNNASLFDS